MALLISEDCIHCDICRLECPNGAISSGADKNVIDSARCTECVGHYDEPQCQKACPVNCITSDPDVVESREMLEAKFGRLQQAGQS